MTSHSAHILLLTWPIARGHCLSSFTRTRLLCLVCQQHNICLPWPPVQSDYVLKEDILDLNVHILSESQSVFCWWNQDSVNKVLQCHCVTWHCIYCMNKVTSYMDKLLKVIFYQTTNCLEIQQKTNHIASKWVKIASLLSWEKLADISHCNFSQRPIALNQILLFT